MKFFDCYILVWLNVAIAGASLSDFETLEILDSCKKWDSEQFSCYDYDLNKFPMMKDWNNYSKMSFSGNFTELVIDSGYRDLKQLQLTSKSSNFIINMKDFAPFSNLKRFEIERSHITALKTNNLTTAAVADLSFYFTTFDDFNAVNFTALINLTSLTLTANNLSGVFMLKNLPKTLTHLNIALNPISELPCATLKDMVTLEHLALRKTDLVEFSMACLPKSLKLLSLSKNSKVSFVDLSSLKSLTQLNFLEISSCHNLAGELDLSFMPSALTTLRLYNNSFDSIAEVESLELLSSVPQKLNELHLAHNRLSEIPCSVIMALKDLTRLYLNNNRLQAFDVQCLNPDMEVLSLTDNNISYVTVYDFAEFNDIGLYLENNPIRCDCPLLHNLYKVTELNWVPPRGFHCDKCFVCAPNSPTLPGYKFDNSYSAHYSRTFLREETGWVNAKCLREELDEGMLSGGCSYKHQAGYSLEVKCTNGSRIRRFDLGFQEKFSGIESLTLAGTFEQVHVDSRYDELRRVRLSSPLIRIVELDRFATLHRLARLNLTDNSITRALATRRNYALRRLDLRRNRLISIDGFDSCFPRLIELAADDNEIAVFNFTALPADVRIVRLARNKIAELRWPADPTTFKRMTFVDLSHNRLRTFAPDFVVPNTLKSLLLANNQIVSFNIDTKLIVFHCGLRIDLLKNNLPCPMNISDSLAKAECQIDEYCEASASNVQSSTILFLAVLAHSLTRLYN